MGLWLRRAPAPIITPHHLEQVFGFLTLNPALLTLMGTHLQHDAHVVLRQVLHDVALIDLSPDLRCSIRPTFAEKSWQ